MNLQHHYMQQALGNVKAVKAQPKDVRDAYVGLTHEIPALVLSNGLVLTAAYIQSKAAGTGHRAKAFLLIQHHMEEAIEEELRSISGDKLMAHTLTLLDAWVYYKRFAVSVLDAPNAEPGSKAPDELDAESPAEEG